MENVFNLLGGRKMTIALLGLVSIVALAYTKPEAITTEFVAALLGLVTAFNTANAFNTVKGPRNDSTPPSVPPVDLYSEFLTLTDETKVNAMNMQSQVDTTNSRIEALADIIQKSLLTKTPQQANMSIQTTVAQPATEMSSVPRATEVWGQNNAELNRQSINQYLTNQQFNR